jgi:methionyl-tRNA formyltransferase
VRIVFAGTPEPALPALNAVLGSTHDVVAVVTRPDAPSGRGRGLHPSPVGARADELGIEVLKPARPRDADFLARLTELAPDCCPVVAYGALIPQHVLDIPAHGWVNLHFSLLPAWRGAAPVQHAILAGNRVTGASTFRLVAELDAGPVYATVTETIGPSDTSGDLLARLSASGARLLVDTLDGIADGSLTPEPQPSEGITFAPKIHVEDAKIDWAQSAVSNDRLIRGCHPSPGAWTTFRGERLKVSSATVTDSALPVGRLEVTKHTVRVGTATTALELTQVQAPGKKPMPAADWARGVSFHDDETLGAGAPALVDGA